MKKSPNKMQVYKMAKLKPLGRLGFSTSSSELCPPGLTALLATLLGSAVLDTLLDALIVSVISCRIPFRVGGLVMRSSSSIVVIVSETVEDIVD